MNRRSPSGPRISWQDPVDSFADLPADGNEDGDVRITTLTDELWVWNGLGWVPPTGLGTDEKVKVTAADALAGYLFGKIEAGLGVLKNVQNPGGNELLRLVAALTTASPQTLAAIDATPLPDGATISVGVVNDQYQLMLAPSANVAAAVDGVNVVTAASPPGAVWIRKYVLNLPAQYQPTWFIDALAGDDRNDGLTALTALKTMGELTIRLRSAVIRQNVTITLAAGDYSASAVSFDVQIAGGVSVYMTGAVSSVIDTIAATLPTVPGASSTNAGAQRGSLTATALSFAATDDRKRLRLVDGPSAGAMAYITRVVTPGLGGTVNVTRWGRLTSPLTSTVVTNITPTVGTTYAIDTLATQVGQLDLRVRGSGRFVIQDCLVRQGVGTSACHRCQCDNGNVNGVLTYGCTFEAPVASVFQGGPWTQAVCSISAGLGVIAYAAAPLLASRMNVWTGTAAFPAFTLTLQSSTTIQANEGSCLDGGKLVVFTGSTWDQISQSGNDLQFVDGTGSNACEIAQTGQFWAHGSSNLQWGLDNAYTGAAFLVTGQYFYNVRPSVPGGTTDFSVGGTTGAYAALPIIKTTAAAGTAASAGAPAAMVA